jgi:hypothetical protein
MLIGAGIGAIAGGGVGLYMDNQEAKLRQRLEGTGVSVTRAGDRIILNMPSSITFDTDRADLKPQFYDVLNSVAIVLAEFNKTLVDVTGHTDSDGSDDYNQRSLRTPRRSRGAVSRLAGQQPAALPGAGHGREPARGDERLDRRQGRRTAAWKSRSFPDSPDGLGAAKRIRGR